MARVTEVNQDDIRPDVRDPEKSPSQVRDEPVGNQIPHEMLEELAPNGEEAYILDKINNMTEEEAKQIVEESLTFHADGELSILVTDCIRY